jgi:hypothetical protein
VNFIDAVDMDVAAAGLAAPALALPAAPTLAPVGLAAPVEENA